MEVTMADISIEADQFGATIEQILGRLESGIKARVPAAVERALEIGENSWKRNARAVLSRSYSRGGWGKQKQTYTKSGRKSKKTVWYGRTIRTGKYARSISHHMLYSGGELTEGEIGSPSMAGLAHLLEKGHALMGGGSARAFVHIEPAAEDAFANFEKRVNTTVEEAINDA